VVVPYATHLGARISRLLEHARLGVPLQSSALRSTPCNALLYAFGGWLAVAAIVGLDCIALLRSLAVLCVRVCCLPCHRRGRPRATCEARLFRALAAWLACLDRTLDEGSADALLLQRCAGQLLYCSVPSLVACAVALASPVLADVWAHGYDGAWAAGGAAWSSSLLTPHLTLAVVVCAASVVLQGLFIGLEARALNAPLVV
jgi:hypothetical protein